MGNFGMSSETQSANKKADSKENAHRVPDGNKDSTGNHLGKSLVDTSFTP